MWDPRISNAKKRERRGKENRVGGGRGRREKKRKYVSVKDVLSPQSLGGNAAEFVGCGSPGKRGIKGWGGEEDTGGKSWMEARIPECLRLEKKRGGGFSLFLASSAGGKEGGGGETGGHGYSQRTVEASIPE